MFAFLNDDNSDNKFFAYIISLLALVSITLIISLTIYRGYTVIAMAKLGYEETTIQGRGGTVYKKTINNYQDFSNALEALKGNEK